MRDAPTVFTSLQVVCSTCHGRHDHHHVPSALALPARLQRRIRSSAGVDRMVDVLASMVFGGGIAVRLVAFVVVCMVSWQAYLVLPFG